MDLGPHKMYDANSEEQAKGRTGVTGQTYRPAPHRGNQPEHGWEGSPGSLKQVQERV